MIRKNLRHSLFLVLSLGSCAQFAAAADARLADAVDGVHQRVIGDLAAVEIEEVAGAFAERAAEVGGEHAAGEIRLISGDGVAGVESAFAVIEAEAAAHR